MSEATGDRNTLRAGVGKADITFRGEGTWDELLDERVKKHIPPEYLKMPVAVSDPLFVRALVLDDGVEPVVLLTMDVTAIGARTISQNILSDSADDFVPRLRQRIEAELGLSGRNVSIAASHTHQVPRMLCDDDAQVERTLDAIRQAQRSMVPVTVGVSSGCEESLTYNRTLMMKDGTDHTVRSYYAPLPPDDQVEAMRRIDPEIGVLRLDRPDGSPLAVVYNFAAHLLLGAPDGTCGTITADHVGVVLRYLEEHIAGGVMAFCLQGALGDASEVCQFDIDHPCNAHDFGTRLGASVLRTYKTAAPGSAELGMVRRTVDLPLRTDIPDVIAALQREQAELIASLRYTTLNFKAFLPLYLKHALGGAYPSHWPFRYLHAESHGDAGFRILDDRNRAAMAKYLQSIQTMERMANNEENIATLQKQQEVIEQLGVASVPAEFLGIRVGDTVFITAPMELLAETGLKVKQRSPFKHTYVVSLANGYLHYAPPAAYYPRGGYEVTECLLAPAWEALFEQAVGDLFDELRASEGQRLSCTP